MALANPKNLAISGAATDLQLGDQLSQQLADQEEERKKRLLQQQGNNVLSPAGAMLGLSSGIPGA